MRKYFELQIKLADFYPHKRKDQTLPKTGSSTFSLISFITKKSVQAQLPPFSKKRLSKVKQTARQMGGRKDFLQSSNFCLLKVGNNLKKSNSNNPKFKTFFW